MAPCGGKWIASGNCFNYNVDVCEVQFCFPPLKLCCLLRVEGVQKEKLKDPRRVFVLAAWTLDQMRIWQKPTEQADFPAAFFSKT